MKSNLGFLELANRNCNRRSTHWFNANELIKTLGLVAVRGPDNSVRISLALNCGDSALAGVRKGDRACDTLVEDISWSGDGYFITTSKRTFSKMILRSAVNGTCWQYP